MAEAGSDIVSLDHSTTPSFDNGFADDLEHSLENELATDDTDLSFDGTLESDLNSGISELGELDELDQALSELGADTDLASLDNEFGDLLNETSASDLALSESELSIEMPTELTDDLPDTLDFSNTEELAAFEQNDAVLDSDLDADLDLHLSDLGDLDSGLNLSTTDVADAAPEVTAETLTAESATTATAEADEFDFADSDEVATKLDLARAYIDMGDTDGAREILDEVVAEGNDEQKGQASELLARIA
jgi:pilus assembly protein FimV